MNINEFKQAAVKLMQESEAAFLTTIDRSGYPHTRAMLNLWNRVQFPLLADLFGGRAEDLLMYLTTNTSSNKITQIKANPAATVYYCVPSDFRGMMLSGVIEIINDPSVKKMLWQEGWDSYYPKGYDDPDHSLLRLLPAYARGWHDSERFEFKLG